jgi:signal transduction histidine kinase
MPPLETSTYRVDPGPGAGDTGPNSAALLRRVTAGLAHNVNNALAGVVSYLELALRAAEPGTALHRRLTEALRCAWRTAECVRRTVAFARRPEARLRSTVCLKRAAEDAARRAADRPGLAVTLLGGESACPVRANESLLHLAVEQLVSNAAEAMPDGGTLALRAWDEGHRRCLSVTDTGHGLSGEVRRHLFQPFFTTKSFGHLGLGLALCRDMIEAQGGALHVTSTEGHGTTVTLSFPPTADLTDLPASSVSAAAAGAYQI